MIRSANPAFYLALISAAIIPGKSLSITPVLDGYAYELYDDVIIDTQNNIISIDSNMLDCQQPGGAEPLETALLALHNINNSAQFIGLHDVRYDITTETLYFTSQTSNLTCTNGVFVDTIYTGGFE